MWTCPTCFRQFKKTNQLHSCKKVSTKDIFNKRPTHLVDLYHELLKVIHDFGAFKQEAFLPDGIFLKTETTFLTVKIKSKYLEITFYLKHLENIHPVQKYRQTSKHRFAHIVAIDEAEDIDQQLITWMKTSYLNTTS